MTETEWARLGWDAAELVFGDVFVLVVRLGLLWRRRRRRTIEPV